MAPVQNVFRRYEKKYLLSKCQFDSLMEELEPFMQIDQYGLHTICNIYYDTEQYDLIRTSIEKPVYKEKFRVRSYGVPKEDDPVFLEIKKKYKGVVYKRRVSMPLQTAKEYLIKQEMGNNDSQIMKEISYFMKFYQPVPKVYIAYDRIAMFGKQDPNQRITFDTNIRSRVTDLDLDKGDYGQLLLDKEQYLMEVKILGAIPLWLSQIFTKLEIYPTSFSKYGNVYKTKLCNA